MTALGKTMVIFVFLLTLVWAGLVVNTWVTRTNWKAEAEKQNKIAKENYDGAKAISEQSKADRSASDFVHGIWNSMLCVDGLPC